MSEWQDIASAPKDQDHVGLAPRIMLAAPPVNASGWMIAEGFWRQAGLRHRSGWVTCMDPNVEAPYFVPTHWQPLPAPPHTSRIGE